LTSKGAPPAACRGALASMRHTRALQTRQNQAAQLPGRLRAASAAVRSRDASAAAGTASARAAARAFGTREGQRVRLRKRCLRKGGPWLRRLRTYGPGCLTRTLPRSPAHPSSSGEGGRSRGTAYEIVTRVCRQSTPGAPTRERVTRACGRPKARWEKHRQSKSDCSETSEPHAASSRSLSGRPPAGLIGPVRIDSRRTR
jgi:hypothetical protein